MPFSTSPPGYPSYSQTSMNSLLPSSRPSSILIILFISQFIFLTSAQKCYFYDTKEHAGASPCTNNTVSHCCSSYLDVCLVDTLCLSQWGTLFIGSCTEKNWNLNTEGCPKYCVQEAEDGATGDIIPCENRNGVWHFCCGIGCCDKSPRKDFTIANVSNLYGDRPSRLGRFDSSPTASVPISNSGQALCTQTSSTCDISGSPCPSTSSSDLKIKTQFGVGLGVGLGIPLLIALALLYLEHRKRIGVEGKLASSEGLTDDMKGAGGHVGPLGIAEVQEARPELQGHIVEHELPSWENSGAR
ncbi:hypothetical protein K469DRAFT_749243 [Zopfia rhizophila CBS 207.26]|uniref:Mid2 domain-containing protein n=1 Tax=Zopfia rhizophila CBS 207.26 TaxID=1314779 RepID=A0A6A6E4H7_9PEZI|nr:hypothetical protein K469DRAFT_749243 [Zopfia rhizophila CBS 207.26]